MDVQHAKDWLWFLLGDMSTRKGSDLLITALAAPAAKVDGKVLHLSDQVLSGEDTLNMAQAIMTEQQFQLFLEKRELDFTVSVSDRLRFRVNAFMQLGQVGMVFRAVTTVPPHHRRTGLAPGA